MNKDHLRFLPRSRQMMINPNPYYHLLRKEAPIYWSEDSSCWVLTRYDDINTILKDERFGRGTTYRIFSKTDEEMNEVEQLRFNLLPFKDGEAHHKIRKAMNSIFHARVKKIHPYIEDLANSLIDKAKTQENFDLISDYAYPFSVGVISKLLGIPDSDKDIFKKYSAHFSALLVPKKTDKDIALAQILITELKDYFNTLLQNNADLSSDNLISDMLHMCQDVPLLSKSEILAMPIFLIFAGHETSMNMIGNGMYELFQQPIQLKRIIQEPEHIHSAIEELLRITSTNSALYRIALEDVEVSNITIKKGEEVVAVLAAANRDPKKFPNPDRIDITRNDGANLTFGAGIHSCMGATLGRIEARIAYETLLTRLPNIQLVEEPTWKEAFIFRGLHSLLVST
jgi:cytochrome P450